MGTRYSDEPAPLGESGLTATVIETRRAAADRHDGRSRRRRARIVSGTDDSTNSWLGVPILAGDRVIGVIALERRPAERVHEADERLVSTIAASLGVALENARLFDETKRLLAETEQRAGELAIINEIGAALAKQLDFQGIIDAVGDRVGVDSRHPGCGRSRSTTRPRT